MRAAPITLSEFEVGKFVSLTDPRVRNILTRLSRKMTWDEPVQSRFLSTDMPIAIVAQWWAGRCVTGKYTVFGAVKVLLWYDFVRGMHLDLVTDCPLPQVLLGELCQSLLEEIALPLSHRGAIEGGEVTRNARETSSLRLAEPEGKQLGDVEPNDLQQRLSQLQGELEVLRQRGRVLAATAVALDKRCQSLANSKL